MNKSRLKRALILGCVLFLGTIPEGYALAVDGITYEEGFVVDEEHKGIVRPVRPAEVFMRRSNAEIKESAKSGTLSLEAKKEKGRRGYGNFSRTSFNFYCGLYPL